MIRLALLAAFVVAALLSACAPRPGPDPSLSRVKTEFEEDRRFIWGIPQNDR